MYIHSHLRQTMEIWNMYMYIHSRPRQTMELEEVHVYTILFDTNNGDMLSVVLDFRLDRNELP